MYIFGCRPSTSGGDFGGGAPPLKSRRGQNENVKTAHPMILMDKQMNKLPNSTIFEDNHLWHRGARRVLKVGEAKNFGASAEYFLCALHFFLVLPR
jgi:hypothetical protein